MKIAIGFEIVDGPWGGGNRFVTALSGALRANGHSVVYSLGAPDIDFILMMDPRTRIPNITFGGGAILRYLTGVNPNAIAAMTMMESNAAHIGV